MKTTPLRMWTSARCEEVLNSDKLRVTRIGPLGLRIVQKHKGKEIKSMTSFLVLEEDVPTELLRTLSESSFRYAHDLSVMDTSGEPQYFAVSRMENGA